MTSPLPLSRVSNGMSGIRSLPTTSGRSRAAIGIGVLLIAGFSLAFVLTALHIDHRPAVLVVRNSVAAGQVVKASDLGVARVSVDASLHPIAASKLSSIVGRPAAVALVPGTLVTDGQLGTNAELQASQTLVGIAVKPGQFPPGLAVGSIVRVVQTASDGTAAVIATGAVVTSVNNPSGGDVAAPTVVGIKVDSTASTAVAAASAAGNVAIVQEPPR